MPSHSLRERLLKVGMMPKRMLLKKKVLQLML
jgi:hypothetical protein